MKRTLPFITCVALLCVACEKQELNQGTTPQTTTAMHNGINEATFAEKVAYAEQHLDVLGKAVLLMHSNQQFRQLLYGALEQEGQDLEERTVLFKDLLQKAQQQNWDLEAAMNTALANASITGVEGSVTHSLEAFKGLDGEDWNPEIYVPNYDSLKTANRIGQLSGELKPIYLPFGGDETQEHWPAYKLNNNSFEYYNDLDNNSLVNQQVFVMRLGATPGGVNPNTNPFPGGPILPSGPGSSVADAVITSMKVKTRYESSVAGKSDIAFRGFTTWHTVGRINPFPNTDHTNAELFPFVGSGSTNYDFSGILIRKYTKKEIRNGDTFNPNFEMVDGWHPYYTNRNGDLLRSGEASGEYCHYLIYEADPWPAGRHDKRWTWSTGTTTTDDYEVSYRSHNGAYVDDMVIADDLNTSGIYYGNRIINNNDIEYTISRRR